MEIIHINIGGPDRKIVDEAGKQFTFEDHRYFGPNVVDKRGDPLANQPGPKASFWRVTAWWTEQGKKLDSDGLCIWTKPVEREPRLVYIKGRHYQAIWDEPDRATTGNATADDGKDK